MGRGFDTMGRDFDIMGRGLDISWGSNLLYRGGSVFNNGDQYTMDEN